MVSDVIDVKLHEPVPRFRKNFTYMYLLHDFANLCQANESDFLYAAMEAKSKEISNAWCP